MTLARQYGNPTDETFLLKKVVSEASFFVTVNLGGTVVFTNSFLRNSINVRRTRGVLI